RVVENQRPAVAPGDRKHEGLASDVGQIRPVRPYAEKHRPPLSGWRLNEVSVYGGRNWRGSRRRQLPLGENRISRIRHVRSADRVAPEHDLRMLAGRAVLGA